MEPRPAELNSLGFLPSFLKACKVNPYILIYENQAARASGVIKCQKYLLKHTIAPQWCLFLLLKSLSYKNLEVQWMLFDIVWLKADVQGCALKGHIFLCSQPLGKA